MTNIFIAPAKIIGRGLSTFCLVDTRAGITINSNVLTENGYKPIEELTLEDKVLTKNGTFQRIKKISRNTYSGTFYSIRAKYHPNPIQCTVDQEFLVRTKRDKEGFSEPFWKKACDLTKDDFLGMVVNIAETIPEFKVELKKRKIQPTISLENPTAWWVLGYFVGDGWVLDSKKKDGRLEYLIQFIISDKDESQVLPRIQTCLPIKQNKIGAGCKEYRCRNALWFSIFKLFGKYAYGKKLPEFVQNAPKNLALAFIEGYEAADGYSEKAGSSSITTVSFDLAFGIQRLYLKIGRIYGITKSARQGDFQINGIFFKKRTEYFVRGLHKPTSSFSFFDANFVWYKLSMLEAENKKKDFFYLELEYGESFTVENLILRSSNL